MLPRAERALISIKSACRRPSSKRCPELRCRTARILVSSRLPSTQSARRCPEHVEDHDVANVDTYAPCARELGLLDRLHRQFGGRLGGEKLRHLRRWGWECRSSVDHATPQRDRTLERGPLGKAQVVGEEGGDPPRLSLNRLVLVGSSMREFYKITLEDQLEAKDAKAFYITLTGGGRAATAAARHHPACSSDLSVIYRPARNDVLASSSSSSGISPSVPETRIPVLWNS